MPRPASRPAGLLRILPPLLAASLALGPTTLALGGCATVLDGFTQPITVATEPQGATCDLWRNGQTLGRIATPGSLTVRRDSHDIVLTCTRPGSQTVRLTLAAQFTGTTVGNAVTWGPLGLLVDGVNGADFRYRGDLLFPMPPAGPDTPALAEFRNPNTRPPLIEDRPGPATSTPF